MENEKRLNAELKLEDLENVAGGAGGRPSGFSCPQCKGFIPVSMQQVITESVIICSHCGYQLHINHQGSQPVIED